MPLHEIEMTKMIEEIDVMIGIAIMIAVAEIGADRHANLEIIDAVHIGIPGTEKEIVVAEEMIGMGEGMIEIGIAETGMTKDPGEEMAIEQMFQIGLEVSLCQVRFRKRFLHSDPNLVLTLAKRISDNLERRMRIEVAEKVCFHLIQSRMEQWYLQPEPCLISLKTM